MLYVQQSLGDNEELIHIGKFHWMYTAEAFLSIMWGMIGSIIVIVGAVEIYRQLGYLPQNFPWLDAINYLHPGIRIFSFLVFVFGLMKFAQMMIVKASTEIAITNTRLIYKRGLVARQVGEMSIDRIEGVNVLQSVLGRLLNYGRLAVRGMGVGEVILPPIENPIAFRQAIEKAKTI